MSANGPGQRIKTVRRTLADGSVRAYTYDLAAKSRDQHIAGQRDAIHRIAEAYVQSPEFHALSLSWQHGTRSYIGLIEDHLRWMTFKDIQDRKARTEFYALRDSLAHAPARADKLMHVLHRLLAWAEERGLIEINRARAIKKLVPRHHSRAERIWSPDQQADFLAVAHADIAALFRAALLTGMRRGDLAALTWGQFDGDWIVYTPGKTAKRTGIVVHLPVFALAPLKALLAARVRCAAGDRIFTTRTGIPWGDANVKLVFGLARAKAGLAEADLHFHDARGTLLTALAEAGCTDAEQSAISGHIHARGDGGRPSQLRSYVKRTRELALNAFIKLDRHLARETGQVVRLVDRAVP